MRLVMTKGNYSSQLKALFKQKADLSFLDHHDPTALANDIGQFFVQKIECIRSELIDSPSSQPNTETSSTSSIAPFDKFKEMNEEDVKHLITKSGKKSCALDPMPTSLVIECLDVLCPAITRMINLSLDSLIGLFPDNWEHAEVRPGVKNNSSSDLSFSNLRPISSLTFISKLTEQAVSDQTYNHLSVHNLYPKNQSAYRKFRSTKTALLRIKHDILMNMNQQCVTLLVTLDLSAAFDTIDHVILLKRLHSFGISGRVIMVSVLS